MLDWPGVISPSRFPFGECLEGWRLLSQLCRAWGVQSRPSWLGLGRWIVLQGLPGGVFHALGLDFGSASKLARLTTAAHCCSLHQIPATLSAKAFERKVSTLCWSSDGLQPLLVGEQAQRVEFGSVLGSGSTQPVRGPGFCGVQRQPLQGLCHVPGAVVPARLLKGRLAPGWAALGYTAIGEPGTWALGS